MIRSALLLLGGCCTAAQGDTVKLSGDHQLSGHLRSMDTQGVIEWSSPLSPEVLKLKADKLDSIEFAGEPPPDAPAPILLTLRNGDLLPVNIIEQIDLQQLKLTNPTTGRITAPRTALDSAQFGPREDKLVYEGPANLREWLEDGGEADNWDFTNGSLVSSGSSLAARRFDLPPDFVLCFSLAWGKGSANFSTTFADPLTEGGKPVDRYRLLYNESGMRVERQVAATGKTQVLAQWQRRISQQRANNKLTIEIRVRRSEGRLEIITNGRTEGIIADPFGNIPGGGGVTLANHSGSTLIFREIRIAQDQAIRLNRHLAQDRGDGTTDSLITADDDRWSGQLLSISTDRPPLLRFQTNVDKTPWDIPQNEVSTIFFAQAKQAQKPSPSATYRVELHHEGHLSLRSLRIEQKILHGEHPWLGAVRIPLAAVHTIARIQPSEVKEPQPQE